MDSFTCQRPAWPLTLRWIKPGPFFGADASTCQAFIAESTLGGSLFESEIRKRASPASLSAMPSLKPSDQDNQPSSLPGTGCHRPFELMLLDTVWHSMSFEHAFGKLLSQRVLVWSGMNAKAITGQISVTAASASLLGSGVSLLGG